MQNPIELKVTRNIKRAGARQKVGVDPEWLSETIGAIYDCAIQPANWGPTITEICRELGFANAGMDIVRLGPDKSNSLHVNAGVDEDFASQFGDYIADSLEMWGGRSLMEKWPLEEPAVASQIIPLEHKLKNRYYIDILGPRGFTDGAIVPLAREPNLFCYLGLNRHSSAGDVTTEVVDALRLLAPHLRRAVTIGDLFDLKAVESANFGSVLDAMSCAVFLVDERLCIVHANRSGSAMIANDGALATNQGALDVRNKIAQAALCRAVEAAAADEATLTRRGIGIPLQGPDGQVTLLHVLSLQRGIIRPSLNKRAAAAIFVVDGGDRAQTPIDALAMIFDFTPAESLIFASLAKGQSLEKTAETLGVAKSTARTHLQHIFEKTGCKRQAELVALALRHSLPI